MGKNIVSTGYDIGYDLDSSVDQHVLNVGKKKVDSHMLVTVQSNNEFELARSQLGSDLGPFL